MKDTTDGFYMSVYKILVTQWSGYWYTGLTDLSSITVKKIDVQWNWINFPK